MRKLMAHSVSVWESDPEAFSYHPVGYMQISPESMREDVKQIHSEQQAIGYESVFIEGEQESREYMLNMFDDWQAEGITSVLHEKKGGYSNNTKAMYGLAKKVEDLGVRIITGVEVTGFTKDDADTVIAVETNLGTVGCESVVIGAGPWVIDFWKMLDLPAQIEVKDLEGNVHSNVDMWRFWQLEEGVLRVDPETLKTNDGKCPLFFMLTQMLLYTRQWMALLLQIKMWGIYYKPDWHFGGIQGGAAPYEIKKPAEDVAIDPYGPSSPEFVSGPEFAHMWVSALAHCHKRFEGTMPKYHKEPSGGIGCFTADSFPVIDTFNNNVTIIADSNHGYKMIGLGCLVAEELMGEKQDLLEPFRFSRFKEGKLHPVSNSPYPWS